MTIIEALDFDSAEAFLINIRRSHERWIDRRDPAEAAWVFRGHGDASWSLLPRAFRPHKPGGLLSKLRERIASEYGSRDWRKLLNPTAATLNCSDAELAETAIDALTHAGAVRLFAVLADEVRHGVTFDPLLWHVFSESRREFHTYFSGRLKGKPAEAFAIAQHHGIPTQFLDWTLDPLVAAYFAVEGAIATGSSHLAVWAIRRELFDREWSLCRFTVRAGVTPFLDAQAGLFTWSRRAYMLRAERGFYVPFEDLALEADASPDFTSMPRPFLRKLTLPNSESDELLKLLWRERVTPAHLMPTFDHVTRALEQKARWY